MVHYLSSKHKYEVRTTQPCVAICPHCLLHITNRLNHHHCPQNRGSEQGQYGDCQYNVLDCLITILIGGWNFRNSGEFLLIYACVRQIARGTNRLLSYLSVYYIPARFDASNFNQRGAAPRSHTTSTLTLEQKTSTTVFFLQDSVQVLW